MCPVCLSVNGEQQAEPAGSPTKSTSSGEGLIEEVGIQTAPCMISHCGSLETADCLVQGSMIGQQFVYESSW